MIFWAILDPLIIFPVLGLTGMSFFLLGTSTSYLLQQQVMFFLLGMVVYVFFASIEIRIWSKFIWIIYLFSLMFLAASLVGPQIRGTHRWIDLGFTNIQPSEVVKPFLVMVFAYLFSIKKGKSLFFFLKPILLLFPIIYLIFRQPDVGNVLVYLIIFLGLEITAGIPWRYLFFGGFFSIFFLPFLWFIMKIYQRERIISFLSSKSDPAGAGYNALQSMIAIGSGQLLGLGLGRGTQSYLLFLPEYHTDFVYAALVEALGFFGGVLVIFFNLLLLGRILAIGISSENYFGKILTVGIFLQFFSQVFINIGMNLGILPITGITLPLVSYGGSSIISSFIGLGLVASIAREHKKSTLEIK